MDMYKITNRSTTYIAVENTNVAPGQSVFVSLITTALHYLESKGAIQIEPVKEPVKKVELPKKIEAPKKAETPFVFVSKPKRQAEKENN